MKKLKIFLLICLLLCFGFALSTEVHASGPKLFEVNDVLPATTQLRISWDSGLSSFLNSGTYMIETIAQPLITIGYHPEYEVNVFMIHGIPDGSIYMDGWMSPYTDYSGGYNYIVIDTSSWYESERTIYSIDDLDCLYWEDLNVPTGYTITFNSHGGTTIPDIEGAFVLPTPLPTPTKEGYTFVGWYYDIEFTQIANAGDPIESDVSLYAKWGRTFAPKNFEVGDILSPGQIRISWDFSDITISEDDFIRIEGTNDFAIYMAVEDVANSVEMWIMGYYTDLIKGNIMINLDDISVITEIKSDGGSNFWHILDDLSWEYIGDYQDGYSVGYTSAREYYGFYDSSTNEWLSVTEYIDRYGTDKMDQTDFYNNFDKYFIPAMIIVFGGAIVLTLLKVFKGRE